VNLVIVLLTVVAVNKLPVPAQAIANLQLLPAEVVANLRCSCQPVMREIKSQRFFAIRTPTKIKQNKRNASPRGEISSCPSPTRHFWTSLTRTNSSLRTRAGSKTNKKTRLFTSTSYLIRRPFCSPCRAYFRLRSATPPFLVLLLRR
jgi:hypothetical protein